MNNTFLKQKLDNMTLDEKIGLLFTIVIEGTTYCPLFKGAILDHHCGGIRIVTSGKFGQVFVIDKKTTGEDPKTEKIHIPNHNGGAPHVTLRQYTELLKQYLSKKNEQDGIPLRVVFDQEGGFSRDVTFGGAHVFPKPMGFTAGGDTKMVYECAKALGRMGRSMGINMIHSPILDVNVNPLNPEIYTRSFSDNAEVVAEYSLAQALGFKDAGMIATGKHFPGRGDSTKDAHDEIPVIDLNYDTLWNRELLPYRALIEKNALPAIMTAHTLYPALDKEEVATLSEKTLKGILREKMNFNGVITTDAIGMAGITLKYDIVSACLKTLQAGADMILLRMATADPIGPLIPKIFNRIKMALDNKEFYEKDLDEKVMRILKSYEEAGLFKNGGQPEENIDEIIKDKEITSLCYKSNEQSICVLRNEDQILPLAPNSRALVIEQHYPRTYCPHDGGWYSGIFYDQLSRFSDELSYIEVSSLVSEREEKTIFEHFENFDTIIMTNWFYRSKIDSNIALLEKLIDKGKKVIVVANTPYEKQCVPKKAKNVIVQFGVTPMSLDIVSQIIFGKAQAKGKWPINYQP